MWKMEMAGGGAETTESLRGVLRHFSPHFFPAGDPYQLQYNDGRTS